MKHKLFALFAALFCVTTLSAQTKVSTDQELRDAIADKSNIKLTADIDLSNSTLNIAEGMTVTIDLGGYTLNRRLTKRGEGGGQVITVRKGATLNLSNGTLKGGWGRDGGGLVNEGGTVTLTNVNITGNTADDRGGGISNHGTLTMTGGSITGNTTNDQTDPKGGGGIMNTEGATATLTNVIITGNKVANYGGGGICNFGTLTIDGCTITGNTAITHGAGIWQEGKVYMQGAVTVTGNYCRNGMADNYYKAKDECVINITGSLKNSNIGISMPKAGYITNGYTTYHGYSDPNELFSADMSEIMKINLEAEEAYLASSISEDEIYYIEQSWDADNFKLKATVKTTKDAEVLGNSGGITLTKKLYVVKDNITVDGNILIKPEDGDAVGIILCDGAKLKTNYNMVFDQSTTKAKLHIYGQKNNSGKLDMSDNKDKNFNVRIGNTYYDSHDTEGEINIHGGNMDVNGNIRSAAIGSFSNYADGGEDQGSTNYYAKSGVINIYGGTIKAYGGTASAGIGSGYFNESCGTINIYGGDITATGRYSTELYLSGGAGIGGGQYCYGGNINIYGGNITAVGAEEAAGIGCGQGNNIEFEDKIGPGNINIYAGTIFAQGGEHGAGIGKGDGTDGPCNITISGGHITAKGGTDAAGIGGGEGGNGGTISISGGYVEAYGNDYGAGIGGGQDGAGGNISITGGTVIAKAGRNETGCRAIGPGEGSDDYGNLELGDNMMVTSERKFTDAERKNACWYRTQVRVEPCDHQDATASVKDGSMHNVDCIYCKADSATHTFGDDSQCAACKLIRLEDEGDNSALFTKWADGDAHDFFLSGRKLETDSLIVNDEIVESSKAYTVCLPFDMDLSGRDDLMVYTLSYIKDGKEMVFTQTAKKIEAGKPYLIVIHEGELELLGSGKLAETASEGVRVYDWENREQPLGWWRGTLTKIESADAAAVMAYALQSVGDFRRIRPDTPYAWWGAFRSMYCPDELPATNRFTINKGTFDGFGGQIVNVSFEGDAEIPDDGATGITFTNDTNLQLDEVNSDDAWYDLSGRRISVPSVSPASSVLPKGVYIHKGHKTVIK